MSPDFIPGLQFTRPAGRVDQLCSSKQRREFVNPKPETQNSKLRP